jgi:hypothetical protein
MLEPANGGVAITAEMLKLGRETFYQQSFGNEIPLTEVLGLLMGHLPRRISQSPSLNSAEREQPTFECVCRGTRRSQERSFAKAW